MDSKIQTSAVVHFRRASVFHGLYAALSILGGVFLLYTFGIGGDTRAITRNLPSWRIILLAWAILNAVIDGLLALWLSRLHGKGVMDAGGMGTVYAGMALLSGLFAVILGVRGTDSPVSVLLLMGLYALFIGVLRTVIAGIGVRRVK